MLSHVIGKSVVQAALSTIFMCDKPIDNALCLVGNVVPSCRLAIGNIAVEVLEKPCKNSRIALGVGILFENTRRRFNRGFGKYSSVRYLFLNLNQLFKVLVILSQLSILFFDSLQHFHLLFSHLRITLGVTDIGV